MTRRQHVVAVGAAIGSAYMLLIGGTPLGMTIPEFRIASLAFATAWLGGWAAVAWKDAAWRPRSVFVPVIAAAVAALTVSVVFSRAPRIAAEGLAQSIIFAGGYLLLVELLRRPHHRARIVFAAAAVGVVVSAAYIELIGLEWALFWELVGRIATPPLRPDFASLVYWNPAPVLAIVSLLSLCLVGAVAASRKGAVVAGIGVLLAMVTALLTGTRAGWLAIGGALVLVLLMALLRGEARSAIRAMIQWITRSGSRLVIGAIGAGLGVAAIITLAPGVLRRIGAGGEEVRSSFFVAAIRMFESSPAVGLGPGMWPMDRAIYTAPDEVDEFVVDAHNVYLQNLAATGLLGAVVVILAAVTVGWLLRAGLRDSREEVRRWAWASCLACAYLGLHQLLVSLLNVPAVLFAAVIPVAMVDARVGMPLPIIEPLCIRAKGAVFARWVGTAALVAALVFAWWTTPATTIASYVARAVDKGDWPAADALAREAHALDPSYVQYRFLTGLAAAHQGDEARAASDFESFAMFTDLPEAWVNLAELRLRAGNEAGAIDAIHRAARLGVQHPAVAVALADLAVRAGDLETAVRAGAEAVARAPSLAGDPWWKQDPERANILPAVIDRALEIGGEGRRWEILLMAGRPNDATRAASTASDPPLAEAVIEAWSSAVGAADRVYGYCDANPLEGPIAWCARIASRLGSPDEAGRYRRLATMLRIDPNTTHELRIVPVLWRRSIAGDVTYKASGLSGRNLSLWDVLIPGVPRIDLAG